jgi:hypothetical protein
MIVSLLLLAGFLSLPTLPSATSSSFIKASVVVTEQKLTNLGERTVVFLYIENKAPFPFVVYNRGVREGLGNVLKVESIDVQITANGVIVLSQTAPVTLSITFDPSASPPTVTRTITTESTRVVARLSPIVLPGEKVAVFYESWGVGCEEAAGVHEITFTAHATLNGSPVVLTESAKFKVERSFPPCVEGGVVTSVTGVPVVGATISLTDLTTNTLVATTSTDSMGNFFFDAATAGLVKDDSYQVEVTLSPPFTTLWPSETSSSFTWTGSTVLVDPFPFWAS